MRQLGEQVIATGKMRIAGMGYRPDRELGGERGTGLSGIAGFPLWWHREGGLFEQAQLLGTLAKQRAEFGAVIGTGLLEAAFPALHRDQGDR